MRKHFLFAGILLAASLVFALPSKADTVDFSLTGPGITATFTLPQSFTPGSLVGSVAYVFGITGTLEGGGHTGSQFFGTIDLGNSGSGVWAFGSTGSPGHPGPELGVFVAAGSGTIEAALAPPFTYAQAMGGFAAMAFILGSIVIALGPEAHRIHFRGT